MPIQTIPQTEWSEFLKAFTRRHEHWLVTIETNDVKTGETVASRFVPLQSIQLDLEDQKNPRINVTVRSDEKEIKHILLAMNLKAEVDIWRRVRLSSGPGMLPKRVMRSTSIQEFSRGRIRAASRVL